MHELTALVAKNIMVISKHSIGSGHNISTFVIVELGEKCWDIMWQI